MDVDGILYRLRLIIGMVVLTLIVSSCGMPQNNETTNSDAKYLVGTDAKGRPIGDPIAEFAINTPPGQSGLVILDNSKTVNVRVGRDYISATNERCRKIIVRTADNQSQLDAVCFDGTAWKTALGNY